MYIQIRLQSDHSKHGLSSYFLAPTWPRYVASKHRLGQDSGLQLLVYVHVSIFIEIMAMAITRLYN